MSEIPEHLVEARRRFNAAEARCSELAASLPRAIDIATGEAELTDEQQQAWDRAWTELQEAAVALQLDPWWAEQDNPAKVRSALLAAAKESAAA